MKGNQNMNDNGKGFIVFDVDDVLWDLNPVAAEWAGVDPAKLTTFSAYHNPNLTEAEKNAMIEAYCCADLFRGMKFDPEMVALVNELYHERKEYPVCIVSNSATEEIAKLKRPQLEAVLDLPPERIILNTVNIGSESLQKKLPDNVFALVDDSPHNIIGSAAKHKIMPAKTWNDGLLVNGMLDGCRVDRPACNLELVMVLYRYIMAG